MVIALPSRNYTQHWLVQEAEQRRITELQQRQQSPPANPSPVYENSRTGGTVNNYPFYNQQYYMNRQPPPAPPAENIYSNEQFSWNNGYGGSMDYVNENTYANLGETTGNITTATRYGGFPLLLTDRNLFRAQGCFRYGALRHFLVCKDFVGFVEHA